MGQLRSRIALGVALTLAAPATAQTLRGSLSATGAYFPESPAFDEQPDSGLAAWTTLRLEGSTPLAETTEAVFSGRATLAAETDDLLFGDVSEGFVEHDASPFSFRAGVLDERWGVLDAANPANIVNQLDLVDDYDGDSRLGQPGALVRWLGEDVTLSAMVLPWNRERRLTEGKDRLRATGLDYDKARFEHGEFSPGVAARSFWSSGDVEFALSHFHGTSREPEFEVEFGPGGASLRPVYRQIDQSSAEAQIVLGEYVLRGEAIHRWGQSGRAFFGGGVGLERIFYGVGGGSADLQLFGEGYFDDRPASAPVTPFDNDVSLGGRLILNDQGSTEFSARATLDVADGGTIVEAGAQRRVLDDVVMSLDVTAPLNVDNDPALGGFERDTRILLSLTRYF